MIATAPYCGNSSKSEFGSHGYFLEWPRNRNCDYFVNAIGTALGRRRTQVKKALGGILLSLSRCLFRRSPRKQWFSQSADLHCRCTDGGGGGGGGQEQDAFLGQREAIPLSALRSPLFFALCEEEDELNSPGKRKWDSRRSALIQFPHRKTVRY